MGVLDLKGAAMAGEAHIRYTDADSQNFAQGLRGEGYSVDVAMRMERMVRSEVRDLIEREKATTSVAQRIDRAARLVSWTVVIALVPYAVTLALAVFENGYFKTSLLLFGCAGAAVALLVRRLRSTRRERSVDHPDVTVSAKDFVIAVRGLPVMRADNSID